MVREIFHSPPSSQKVSINFLLNSSPHASLDLKKFASYLPSSSSSSGQGVDHLLNAASLLGKRNIHSATSSDSTFHSSLHRHEVTQQVKPKRRKRKDSQCNECGRTFGDSSSARKHYRVVHLKIKEFKCDHCGKTFAEKSNLSKHVIAAHLNQRSHPCPDCDKVFNFTDGLRRHRNNVHLGLRPYPCQDCNTSYKQKTHLMKHRQSVHGVPMPPKKTN